MPKKIKIKDLSSIAEAIKLPTLDVALGDIVAQSNDKTQTRQAVLVSGASVQAIGRDLFITDPNNVDMSFDLERLKDENPNVIDRIRAKCGNFWTTDSNTSSRRLASDISTAQPHIPVEFLPAASVMETPGTSGNMFETVEIIGLKGNTNLYKIDFDGWRFDERAFWSIFDGVYSGYTAAAMNPTTGFRGTSQVYYDHTSKMALPLDKEEIDHYQTGFAPAYVDIKGVYNFYIEQYENFMSQTRVSEKSLPNLYVVYMDSRTMVKNDSYRNFLSLGGAINPSEYKVFENPLVESNFTTKQQKTVPSSSLSKYFELYASNYWSNKVTPMRREINAKASNMLFSPSEVDRLNEISEKKHMFPMYVEIDFSTDPTAQFADALKKTELGEKFQASIVDSMESHGGSKTPVFESRQTRIQTSSVDSDAYNLASYQIEEGIKSRRTFDITNWFNDLINSQRPPARPSLTTTHGYDTERSIFLGTYPNGRRPSDDAEFGFFRSLMGAVLSDKIKSLVKNHFRTFTELMAGKPAHSETMFYRIEKRTGRSNKALQNFYLMNSSDSNVHKFIDTQVKYNKNYSYTIYAYQLVVGTAYRYENVKPSRDDTSLLAVTVKQTPSLRLIEIPIYSETSRINDTPPVAPGILTVPFKGVSDRVRFIMTNPMDSYKKVPVIIDSGDALAYSGIAESQGTVLGNPMLFSTDDPPAYYEVYRLDTHPYSYSDFAKNKIARIHTTLSSGPTCRPNTITASSMSYDDRISPNKKYYYMFRSVDVHENPSYPSEIHEIEMVQEENMVFLIHNIVDLLEDTKTKVNKKNIKRYIKIEPSISQVEVNDRKMGSSKFSEADLNRLTLGPDSGGIWTRKFKIRLTSKNTGRKLDFNVEFTHVPKKMGC